MLSRRRRSEFLKGQTVEGRLSAAGLVIAPVVVLVVFSVRDGRIDTAWSIGGIALGTLLVGSVAVFLGGGRDAVVILCLSAVSLVGLVAAGELGRRVVCHPSIGSSLDYDAGWLIIALAGYFAGAALGIRSLKLGWPLPAFVLGAAFSLVGIWLLKPCSPDL